MDAPSHTEDWPVGADGDVFRRLANRQFDFSSEHVIDFNVDFSDWPPPQAALTWLADMYPEIVLFEPDAESGGYVQVQLTSKLAYELVITTQQCISDAMAEHGGICESWGVLQRPPH